MEISYKHDDSYLTPSTLPKEIDVFEARVWGWQLHVADLILNGGEDQDGKAQVERHRHGAFVALQASLVYFEMIAKYEAGSLEGDSGRLFKDGVRSVYGSFLDTLSTTDRESLPGRLYGAVRSALYHMAITDPGVDVTVTGAAFTLRPGLLQVDPHALIADIKTHFASYIQRLRDPRETKLQDNFVKCFWRGKGRPEP